MLALLMGVMLTACDGPQRIGANKVEVSHPIHIGERQRSMSISLGEDAASAINAARQRIERFAGDYRQRGIGAMVVSTPEAGAAAGELEAILLRAGIPAANLERRRHQGEEGGGTLSLGFREYAAIASPCGDFRENLGYNPNNVLATNFGCASQNNLAAALANPRDLVEARSGDAADSERARGFIQRYRAGTLQQQSGVSISQ